MAKANAPQKWTVVDDAYRFDVEPNPVWDEAVALLRNGKCLHFAQVADGWDCLRYAQKRRMRVHRRTRGVQGMYLWADKVSINSTPLRNVSVGS